MEDLLTRCWVSKGHRVPCKRFGRNGEIVHVHLWHIHIHSMVWGFPGASRRSPGTVFGRIGGVFRSLGQKTVRKGWLPELFFVSGVTLQRAPGGPGNLTSSPEIYTYRDRRARLTAGFLRPHVLLTRSHRCRRNSPFLELSCFGWATLPKAFGFRNATMDRHCRLGGRLLAS